MSNSFKSSEKAIAAYCLSSRIVKMDFNKQKIRRYVEFNITNINTIMSKTLKLIQITEEKNVTSLKSKFKNNEFVSNQIVKSLKIVKNV